MSISTLSWTLECRLERHMRDWHREEQDQNFHTGNRTLRTLALPDTLFVVQNSVEAKTTTKNDVDFHIENWFQFNDNYFHTHCIECIRHFQCKFQFFVRIEYKSNDSIFFLFSRPCDNSIGTWIFFVYAIKNWSSQFWLILDIFFSQIKSF